MGGAYKWVGHRLHLCLDGLANSPSHACPDETALTPFSKPLESLPVSWPLNAAVWRKVKYEVMSHLVGRTYTGMNRQPHVEADSIISHPFIPVALYPRLSIPEHVLQTYRKKY